MRSPVVPVAIRGDGAGTRVAEQRGMSTLSVHPDRPSILLDDHHARLEAVCAELLADTYADDPRALCERWRSFEHQVLEHIQAEEDVILPAYAEAAPGAAAAIRADHQRLRELLGRLGVEIDLHAIRLRTVKAMLDSLREHADREDRSMYPWAQRGLPTPRLAALRARVEDWLR